MNRDIMKLYQQYSKKSYNLCSLDTNFNFQCVHFLIDLLCGLAFGALLDGVIDAFLPWLILDADVGLVFDTDFLVDCPADFLSLFDFSFMAASFLLAPDFAATFFLSCTFFLSF